MASLQTGAHTMFDMLSGMFCFVTVVISFLYGTRVCWVCGKGCHFGIAPEERKQLLKTKLSAGFAIYAFGFAVLFNSLSDGAFLISVMSLTSALVLSHFVVSMAMPVLKRKANRQTS